MLLAMWFHSYGADKDGANHYLIDNPNPMYYYPCISMKAGDVRCGIPLRLDHLEGLAGTLVWIEEILDEQRNNLNVDTAFL